jgi:putative Mg2+ transporter-C (MgtC) family protein
LTKEIIIIRLLVACVCGALIGVEREKHGRAAGLRTHMLVALGAASVMVMSLMILDLHIEEAAREIVRIDPGRIAAQVVTGIGFIGAGAIIQAPRLISGLTTAACLWVAASIGLAAGMGFFMLAGTVTGLSLASLYLLKRVEHFLRKDRYHKITVKCNFQAEMLAKVEHLLTENKVKIISFGFTHDKESALLVINVEVRIRGSRLPQELLESLTNEPDILKISWR